MKLRLSLLALVPAMLAAQQPADTAHLPPVVVTATRIPTPAGEVPEAVTVLSGAALRAAGISTVFEALRDVPGAAVVQTGSYGGQTSLFLRGGQSNYVKVLVDGVPLNQPGGAYDFANLTTDNVERIEVLRGPASVLYGSDAVSGVVQIFTRQGVGPARADLTVRPGTYGSLGSELGVAGGSSVASYSLTLSRFASEGTYPFNNDYGNTAFSGLVRAAPDDRTAATLTVRYDDHVFHFPTNGAGVPTDHNQFTYGSGPALGLDVGRRLTPRLEARVLLAANETNSGFDNRPDSAADQTLYRSLDDQRRASADLRTNLSLNGGAVVTAGVVLEREDDHGFDVCQTQFGDCGTPPIDTARTNGAAYLQAVADLAGRVSVTGGVRLEDNERFGTYGTYRVGAVYRRAGGTRLRATAGNAFREPAFFENYSTGYSVGNPDLRPEHSWSWEVGVEQSVAAGRGGMSVTFFDQRFRDMIDYNPSAAPGAPNYENVAGAAASGVELGVRGMAAASWSLGGTYTYLSTEVTSFGFDSTSGAVLAAGRPLLRRPKHAARLDVAYRLPARGAVSLALTYVGQRADQDFSTYPFPRVTLPAYTRVDFAAQAEVVRPRGNAPGFGLALRIENLFDRSYEEVKNYPARRRTVLVGGQLALGG